MAETDTSPAALRALADALDEVRVDSSLCPLLDAQDALRALAAEKEAGAPAPDGWIPWEGGECPVAAHTSVDVRFRGGDESRDVAGVWNWQHWNADIIAYRLSEEG